MGRGERLLVSGGAGFVLCNCVHRWLSAHPTHSAVILDLRRVWDAPVQAFLAEFTAAGRLHFFEGDVTRAEDWRRLSETHGTAFTHVVSGAALTPTRADEERRPKEVMAVNVFGTIEALEWARSLLGLRRFIYVSSNGIYGPPGLARDPCTPPPPPHRHTPPPVAHCPPWHTP